MTIDAFSSVECPRLPVKALTPAGIPNIINLNFEIGNIGNTAAVDAIVTKTILVPEGVVLTVLDNAGSIISPVGTVFTAGPNSFVYTGVTIPAMTGNYTPLLGYTVTLQVAAGTLPTTLTEVTQVVATGDVNPGNNVAICYITLK